MEEIDRINEQEGKWLSVPSDKNKSINKWVRLTHKSKIFEISALLYNILPFQRYQMLNAQKIKNYPNTVEVYLAAYPF